MAIEWAELLERLHSDRLMSSLRESKYSRLWDWYGEESEMDAHEFREFCYWARAKLGANKKVAELGESPIEVIERDSVDYAHEVGYYYDETKDLYIVHLQSKKLPMTIPGDMWRSMRLAYSNWDGAPSSVNELTRKFGLARSTVRNGNYS